MAKTKNKNRRKTKMERIIFEKSISIKDIHEKTGIAYPTLFNIIKGRKTSIEDFRKRTLRDLESFLGIPAEDFVGYE